MTLIRPIIFILLHITLTGCAMDPNNPTNKISAEDWCGEDQDMPWSGCWKEIFQIECETGNEFESSETIGELRLLSDDRYSITWHPFEYYTDYAGSFKVNPAESTINIGHIDSPGFDGDGSYLIRENGDLELVDIWLGPFYKDSDSVPEVVSCGYVFRKK